MTQVVRGLRRLLYAPFLSQMVVTRRCNLGCGYCTEYDRHSEPVPARVLCDRIDHVARLGAYGLELTGGEPLLHPELIDILEHGRSKGQFKMLGLISNGYLLTEEKVEALNRAGLTDLQISVDGVEPREETVKVLSLLRSRLEMLSRTARFAVLLSAVVSGGAPMAEITEVIRFAREHGFRPRILLVHDAKGNLPEDLRTLSEFKAAQKMIGRHRKDFVDYRTRLLERGEAPFKCRSGSRYLYVDERGSVSWCAHTRDRFSRPLAEYSYADLKTQFLTPKGCDARCTVGCARSCSMPDQIRGQSLPRA